MKLNLPKKVTFWAAVVIAAVGVVAYVVHLFPQSLPIMDMMGFLLFVAAFILLCLDLNSKRL
jgi:tellurite resistance protein TehA-like permease